MRLAQRHTSTSHIRRKSKLEGFLCCSKYSPGARAQLTAASPTNSSLQLATSQLELTYARGMRGINWRVREESGGEVVTKAQKALSVDIGPAIWRADHPKPFPRQLCWPGSTSMIALSSLFERIAGEQLVRDLLRLFPYFNASRALFIRAMVESSIVVFMSSAHPSSFAMRWSSPQASDDE